MTSRLTCRYQKSQERWCQLTYRLVTIENSTDPQMSVSHEAYLRICGGNFFLILSCFKILRLLGLVKSYYILFHAFFSPVLFSYHLMWLSRLFMFFMKWQHETRHSMCRLIAHASETSLVHVDDNCTHNFSASWSHDEHSYRMHKITHLDKISCGFFKSRTLLCTNFMCHPITILVLGDFPPFLAFDSFPICSLLW
jgi:hypothetical protein